MMIILQTDTHLLVVDGELSYLLLYGKKDKWWSVYGVCVYVRF